MTVDLRHCRIGGTNIPVSADDSPITDLIPKIASEKSITPKESTLIKGFRQMLNIDVRRSASSGKLKAFLVLRLILTHNENELSRVHVMDAMFPKMDLVNSSSLLIPKTTRSRLGNWSVKIGYSALYERELIPGYVPQMISSLPYTFDSANTLSFVVAEPIRVKPNGEYSRPIDVDSAMNSGENSPEDI